MDYRDLIAWRKAMDLAEQIYRHTARYPRREQYGLCSQLRRAAVSIPSNIAEGQGRRSSDEEFVRFLRIAHGSLCELDTQLELSNRLGFLAPDDDAKLRAATNEVGRLLGGLIKSKLQ